MVKTKSCVCVFGQVVVLRWDQRFSQFLRYPTGLFRPRKQRAVEADLLWRIGGRDRTGTMRLADCCVQGRPRSEGYRWVRRATKRTRRLAKSSRFGTRTGSIQEQTGTDRIGHSSGGGGVGGSPAYLYLGATSCRHMAGRAETSGMVVPGGKLHVLSVPSLAMAGRAPAGIHHARRPQPERHGSHPGAVGPVLADRGPWRGIA